VCLPYEPWAYADPSLVRLLHWNGSRWDDVTTSLDQVNDVVCGTTTSLSPFVVAQSLQQLQSITFSPLADQTYGAGPIALSATASSGLAMTYSSTGPCAVNADTLSISGAGTCTVTASQAGNDAWQAAAPVSESLSVNKALLTVSVANQFKPMARPTRASHTRSAASWPATRARSCPGPRRYPRLPAPAARPQLPDPDQPGTLSAANYGFTYVNGSLSVDKAPSRSVRQAHLGPMARLTRPSLRPMSAS